MAACPIRAGLPMLPPSMTAGGPAGTNGNGHSHGTNGHGGAGAGHAHHE